MLVLWMLMSVIIVPIQILDARISAYQQQIARVNCSVQDKLVLSGMMQADMHRHRCVLEDIPYED